MSLRLPVVSRSILPAGSSPAKLREELLRRIRDPGFEHGYVRADVGDRALLLFVYQRGTYCAGVLDHELAMAITVQEFVNRLHAATQISVCTTDLPLFLCTAVLVRKAPAVQILGSAVRGKLLLEQVKAIGKDVVLVVRRGDARNMVFCHGGTPIKLYPAKGERFPVGKDMTQNIVDYARQADPDSAATIDLYEEINLGPTADAGQRIEDFALQESGAQAGGRINPVLAVKLGDRVVFHHVLRQDEVRVGRGLNNDLKLENPSVSRNHAILTKQGDRIVVDDLGSQNGIYQHQKRVDSAELLRGDEVMIGKYRLTYLQDPPDLYVPPQPSYARSPLSAMEQTFSVTGAMPKLLTEGGEMFPIRGLSFIIGNSDGVDIRIGGRKVGPAHARINRTPTGSYIVQHVDGELPLTVNGTAVSDALLQNQDVIEIGKHRFRFVATG